jgi:enoyl-CoA hydratase/carnithine racemase
MSVNAASGTKGRAFCAGADLKAIAAGQSLAAPGHEDWGFAGLTEHYVAKPLIAAAAALRWGLVNRMMPAEQVLLTALELASAICANAPLAVAASKKIMHRAEAAGSDWDADVWAANAEAIRTVFASDDAKEGPRAFGEKRAPRWTGR